MAEADEAGLDLVWVEVEVNKTPGVINTYRGSMRREDLERWASGDPKCAVRLDDVYWQDGDDNVVLGDAGPFSNFTGTVYFRAESVVAVLLLRDGRERAGALSRDRVVRLAPVTSLRGAPPRGRPAPDDEDEG